MSKKKNDSLIFFLFLLPAIFAFVMVLVVPFFLGIYYSLTNWNGVSKTSDFIGLNNFKVIVTEPALLHSFLVTTKYAIMNVIAVNVVAFGLALLVTGKLKLNNVYRAGFFIPNMIGGLVLGYVWKFLINNVLPAMGTMLNIKAIEDLLVFTDPDHALLAIVTVGTWQYAGYIMMIYIASIQSIDGSVVEASAIDGATYFQRLRHIVFPLIAPAFTAASFLTVINSFKQFDVNFALTNGGPPTTFMGSVIKSTELLALNIYNTAFSLNQLALGQAKAVLFFVIIVTVSLIQVYYNKRREIEL